MQCRLSYMVLKKVQLVNCFGIGKKELLFLVVPDVMTSTNGSKLQLGRFGVDIRKSFSHERVVLSWKRFLRESTESLSLEVFQDLARQSHS